eukprot:scaffold3223_cov50-Phaeocystis_antarctica.AAC.3
MIKRESFKKGPHWWLRGQSRIVKHVVSRLIIRTGAAPRVLVRWVTVPTAGKSAELRRKSSRRIARPQISFRFPSLKVPCCLGRWQCAP